MIVKIGDEHWVLKPRKEPRVSQGTELILMGAMAFAGGGIFGSPNTLAGIDIVAEYRLVRSKQSKLSRSKRDMVVAKFESDFKLVPDGFNFLEVGTPQQ